MSTNQAGTSFSTAVAMMSVAAAKVEITRSKIESVLKDVKVDKLIKLETLIQYLRQLKNMPVESYMKETRSLLFELLPKFEEDREYFLPWVRFLDLAHAHKMHRSTLEEQDTFKTGIDKILAELLLKAKKTRSIDWRIARKVLSMNGHFSLIGSDLKLVEEGILKALKAEIDTALEHLLWQKESLFVDSAKTNLISLRKYVDSPTDQDQSDLLEAVRCGRFDKEKFQLKNSIIIGEDGGLYLLLNRMNQQEQDALVAEQVVTKDYLKDKVKGKDEGKGEKIVLGAGGFGTVRFAMSLLRSRSLPAEIVCIKKTQSFQDLSGGFTATPLEQVTTSTLGDYFTNDRALAIYAPSILDLGLVTSKNVIKEDRKDHRKGYLMMEILPQSTGTRIFADQRFQKWEYQKPYLLDVLENTQKLLESEIAMTDLKPDNTLYDTDIRKATIIDLGGSVKVINTKDLVAFDLTKYSFQSTPGFRAPELKESEGLINMHKAIAYSCGKVIEAITRKSDFDQQAISQIIKKLTSPKPEERMSIPEAISEVKKMGDDSYRKNIIFSHYINKIKDRLENKKSAISINEDIDRTRELFITLNSTSSDPSKYKDLKTEDLFKKIDNFLTPGNTKQVMAIFGVAGSGKSVVLQLKFIEAVHAWQPGKPLPIYFNLANGLDLDQIIRALNTQLDTNLSLEDLNGQHFYIDSFDEGLGIENKKETLIKEYFRQLGSAKILITCRTDYLQDNSYEWFTPESKELEVCYVAPINYNGHQDLPKMIEKYVCYSKQHNSNQLLAQDYLKRLKELQLTDLINTGFMFLLVMEVLFQLQDKKEGRVNKVDIYAKYINYYQNNQISKLKSQDQKKTLEKMIQQTDSLCSFATELGKHLACQMHLMNQVRLGESDKLFAALGYDSSLFLKHQSIIHMLKLLPLKIVTTHSGKRVISDQEVKIGFLHETIKNYYLLEAIKGEIEREGNSLILASKSIVHDSELVKLIVLAMKDNPKLATSFLKAIENSKRDKSTSSVIEASNSISLLVAAQHPFSGCDLSGIAVRGASIINGIFHNANLDRADLSGVDMSNVNLAGASLNDVDMRGVNFSIFPDLLGHTSSVQSVNFSPDGKLLASGSFDATIKIWNPSTWKCLRTLNGHTDLIHSVSFSPDGKFLASGSDDKTIKIWNPNTGECLRTLNGHSTFVKGISFSPDGRFLASGSDDKTIKIWNPSTGECLQTLNGHTGVVYSVSFSPDGKSLASGSGDQTIKIWSPNTGKCLQTLHEHSSPVVSVRFSPDGRFLASGSSDETIKIWNPSTGERLQTLNGHGAYVKSVSFSPDSKLLVSGSDDQTIKIWNPSTGECLQTLNGHSGQVMNVIFSPDGRFLASGSDDKTIKIWNPNPRECLQALNGHSFAVYSTSFSPDGRFLASGSDDKTIKIWNPRTGEYLQTLNGHSSYVKSISFSLDSKLIASGSEDGVVKIWNSSTSKCLHTLKPVGNEINNTVWSVSFSPNGKFLATGSDEAEIKIWNPSSGECLQTITGHDDRINSVSFSPDSKLLASGSRDQTIKIWNPTSGVCLKILNGHVDSVCSVYFSPDGKLLASGSWDFTIKIWNLNTSECVQTLNGHTDFIRNVSFSPDGKFLASGSWDVTVKIWNPSTGKCLQTLHGHSGYVNNVSFSPDSKFLSSGSDDRTIKLFEFDTTKNIWLLKTDITAFPSSLVANDATFKKTRISHNNKLILAQKGADAELSTIDNSEHHNNTSPESNLIANQLSKAFLDNFIAHHQSQDFKLVTLSATPYEIPDSNLIMVPNSRSSNCCQIFAMSNIIYDNPLLNNPALFAQISQTFGSIQALQLSNIQAGSSDVNINNNSL